MDDGRLRKQVRHKCGYELQAEVLRAFGAFDDVVTVPAGSHVVMNYRGLNGVLTNVCPGCGKPLKLWWEGSVEG